MEMTRFGRRNARAGRKLQAQIEILETRRVLAADPMITEFQAVNESTVADVDGDFADWVEIHNPDVTEMVLDQWYLTDDESNLQKWQFPVGTRIGPGEYRIVFASGKDRSNPDEELHTNFKLSSNGEYLAFVKPDGVTAVQAFDPFPKLEPDISFGLAPGRLVSRLIAEQSPISAFVPENASLESTWFQTDFDDSQWATTTSGVGYEVLNEGSVERNNLDSLGPEWTVDNPGLATVSVAGGTLTLDVPRGQDTTSENRGRAPIVFRDIPTYRDGTSPQSWEMITHVTQQSEDRGGAGIMIYDGATESPVVKLRYTTRTNFELRVLDDRKGRDRDSSEDTYFLRLARNNLAKTWTGYYKLDEADEWIQIGNAVDGVDDVPVIVDPKPALYAETGDNTMKATFDFVEFIVHEELPSYDRFTGLDVTNDLKDQNGSIYLRMPFTVGGNPEQFDQLNMSILYDDGYRAYLNEVLISEENAPFPPPPPAPNILPWDANAQGTHGAKDGRVPVNLIDLSEHLGILRQGENVLAVQGLNITPDDDDFFFDAQLFASNLVSEKAQLFVQPTPGAANQVPAPEPPIIVAEQGIFFGNTTVEMKLAEPLQTLEIRYTLDGSDPTSESLLYEGPIVLTASAMLQARVLDKSENPTLDPSPVSTATFIAADAQLRNRTSDIPIIILDTLEARLSSATSNSLTSVNVAALEVSKATGRTAIENGIMDYLGRGGIRDRGSSTAGQPKPNLAFETWGPEGTDKDDDANVALLGFSSESDWVLHAPHNFDRAMFRNQLTFDLSNQMGQWAPDTRAVEVYLNRGDGIVTEGDYLGVYVLMEKIKQGKDRLDIAKLDRNDNAEPEISGGYIFKIDRVDPDAGTFSAGGLSLNWVYPKSPRSRTATEDQKATDEQQDWVVQHFREVQDALRRPDIFDPEGYSQYVDVRAWVDHHLLSVYMDDVDAFALSAYLFKDRDGKVAMGPAWDFDRSAESLDDRDNDPTKWGGSGGSNFFSRAWYSQVFRDPGFWQAYVDRWTELRRTSYSMKNMDATIDKLADEIAESQERNYLATVNRGVRPRRSSAYPSGKLDGTWEGEVEHLRAWLHERLQFMDSTFVQPPFFVQNGQGIDKVDADTLVERTGIQVTAGEQIEISGPLVVNFIDTPLISGEVGVSTAKYFSPADDTLGTDWAQPGFDDARWQSGPTGLGFENTPRNFIEQIATEVRPAPDGTTVLMRMPFEISDLGAAQAGNLVLKLKYDDGFVAYLNGEEILRQNVRDPELSWNSRANSHGNSAAVEFAVFELSEFSNLLVAGTNVLGIRAINATAGSSDMLMLPELAMRELQFSQNPNAKVYYTTDGSDPRGPDGNPAASAQLISLGESIRIDQNTKVIARNFDDVIDRGPEARMVRTDWSAPIEYNLVVATPDLAISEVNYNPAPATETERAAGFVGESFEFIEIKNIGATTADLVGIEIADGIEFDFFGSQIQSIEPGGYALVVANEQAFRSRYGDNLPVAGEYLGSLNNTGEDIDLINGLGEVIFSVNYNDNDPWPVRADGFGATLEFMDPASTPFAQQSKWYRWRASRENGGSPGKDPDGSQPVVINEVLSRPQGRNQSDAIELLNVSNQPVDIGGWYLSDSANEPFKFAIPVGTVLQPGQYVAFNEPVLPFGLNGTKGDDIWLVQKGTENTIATFEDDVHFGPAFNGESLGRLPNGSGRLAPMASQSLASENTDPRIGPVIITEIHYNPVLDDATREAFPSVIESDLEFIEIHNPTEQAVDLSNWRLRGGPGFSFDEGSTLAASETAVIVKFDPQNPKNVNELNAFRTQHGVAENVKLFGGYSGQLNNSDDRVELQRPDSQADDPEAIFHVQVDEILYDDQSPWPVGADGTGQSMQRISATAFGNDGNSFISGPPSPGQFLVGIRGDFDGSGQVDVADINLLFEQIRSRNPDLSFDLNGDLSVNVEDRDMLIGSILATNSGDSNLDGVFDSTDLVLVFQANHYEDNIPLNSGWEHGDWNADGDFTSLDLVIAFREGAYVAAAHRQSIANQGHLGGAVLHLPSSDESSVRSDEPFRGEDETDRLTSSRSAILLDAVIESMFDEEAESGIDADDSDDLSEIVTQ